MRLLYSKEGLPEESEIVICNVTKIYHHSVFVEIFEYNISGMIHISEISPGRIRNLYDYVKEGKIIVCKVLRVNPEKKQVDLSLRRVSDSQKRQKVDEIKQEQKAEKIVELVAAQLKIDFKKVYDIVTERVFQKYERLMDCFKEVNKNKDILLQLGLDKKIAKPLTELIEQRIKVADIEVQGKLFMRSFDPNGVDIISKALKPHIKDPKVSIKYMGGGYYDISLCAENYKTAEDHLKTIIDAITNYMQSHNSESSFKRVEA